MPIRSHGVAGRPGAGGPKQYHRAGGSPPTHGPPRSRFRPPLRSWKFLATDARRDLARSSLPPTCNRGGAEFRFSGTALRPVSGPGSSLSHGKGNFLIAFTCLSSPEFRSTAGRNSAPHHPSPSTSAVQVKWIMWIMTDCAGKSAAESGRPARPAQPPFRGKRLTVQQGPCSGPPSTHADGAYPEMILRFETMDHGEDPAMRTAHIHITRPKGRNP